MVWRLLGLRAYFLSPACFAGDGQAPCFAFFFPLYHSACFKPFDLHGCRHHLLSALPYDSWPDRGLFSSCAARSEPFVASPGPGAGIAPSLACPWKQRAVAKDPFLSVFCFVLFIIFSFVLVAFFVWSPPPPQEKAKRRGIGAANLTRQRDARHVKGGGESRCSLSAHK